MPRLLGALLAAVSLLACADQSSDNAGSPWTKFVRVAGQPEAVPEQWVSTPEGKLAHSIVIPNPVPKESGYRRGMTSKEYFDHLCKTEAGEFIFKTVENVEGFYFMRPPKRPTDDELKHRYKLEAPEIERTFQLMRPTSQERAATFVNPPWNLYRFIEEPGLDDMRSGKYLRVFGYVQGKAPMRVEITRELESRYGLTWRGIRRARDRELALAGSEWIVIDLLSKEVLAVQRNYTMTGFTRNTPEGIWWLNAVRCHNVRSPNIFSSRFYDFAIKSIKPPAQVKR